MSEREKVTLDEGDDSDKRVKVATGAFLRTGTVISVEDFSNYPGEEVKRFESGWAPELCLIFIIDDGYTKERKFQISAWFKRDKNTETITGWNEWNNAVKRFIEKTTGEKCEYYADNFSIPTELLQKTVGKEFQFVKYITAGTYPDKTTGEEKPSYANWDKIFKIDEPIDLIKEEFSKDCEWLMSAKKKAGYRYDPGAIRKNDKGDGFNYGANKAEEKVKEQTNEIPDESVI